MLRSGVALRCLCVIGGALATGQFSISAHAASRPTFDIYGFAQADYIYDFNRVDPDWEDTLRPSRIPTVDGIFGSDGQSLFSAKQSRFGVKGDIPVGSGMDDITFKFEFDMFGVGADAGLTTIRLRHAYGEWGQLLAGQTNSLFMDIDIFPNVVDYWGPPGMVFLRNPQFRWTPFREDNSHFSVAIEKASNDIDIGTIREFDPNLGAALQNDEKLPDLTLQYYYGDTWGHFQLAGILRDVAYDSAGTLNNEPKGGQLGWGIDVTGHVNAFEKDKFLAGVVYGQGIASYMNDGGVDLAPNGPSLLDVHAHAVPLLGISFYYDHYWTDRLSTSAGYSFTKVDNTTLQEPEAFHRGEYASINLLYTPVKNVLVGGELLWGQRTDHDGTSGDDVRVQVSVKYDFSTSISL
jgi:hypothetical protein